MKKLNLILIILIFGFGATTNAFTSSTPPAGAIDARDNLLPAPGAGWQTIDLVFSGPATGLTYDLFSVAGSNPAGAPKAGSVQINAQDWTRAALTLTRPIQLGERITINYKPTNSSICLGFLPGDVNQDGRFNATDLSVLRSWVGTTAGLAKPLYQTDINRDGVFNVNDVTRASELLADPNAIKTLPACPAAVSDIIPPSTITDLKLTGLYPNGQVGLNWRAPYEDSNDPTSGAVTTYDIRYQTKSPITDSTWSRADQVTDEPLPHAPGTVEIYILPNLRAGETYYVAIRSQDATGNISALSNNLLITIPKPVIVEPIIPIVETPLPPPLPPPTLLSADPPNNAVMAQDGTGPGWNLVTLTFSSALDSDWDSFSNYDVLSTQVTAISIAGVSGSPSDPRLSLSRNILPGERVTITHKPTNSSVCLGFLPGDVNQDGRFNSTDMSVLRSWVGTATGAAKPLYQTDINRDGVFNATDETRIRELPLTPMLACPSPATRTITASVGNVGGTITPVGTITVNRGTSQTFTITPANSNYQIASVLVDGVDRGPIASYTFSNVQSNQTIVANFKDYELPPIDPGQTAMIMMNGGNYIDSGESITSWRSSASFSSIVNSSGDLIYMFNVDPLGKIMGRFSATKHWEWWTSNRWSGAPGTTATAIEHTVGQYRSMDLVKHPDIANGLIGVASQFYSIGGVTLDTHGHPNNFIFDGTKFTQWQSGATYHQFITSPLITSWNGTGGSPPVFAFDPVSRKGLVIGTVGYALGDFNSQLTAVEYRLDDASQKWRRWNVNNWFANASWPWQTDTPNNRNVFILNRNIDVAKFKTDQPLITNIPNTPNYFITFNYTDVASSAVKRGAAFYQDGNLPVWSWWDGSAWQTGGNYDFQDIRGTALPGSGKPFRQIYWTGGKISIFFNDSGNIMEIIYDHNLKTFSAPVQIAHAVAGTDDLPGFVVGRDSTGKLWLAYGDDPHQIKVKIKSSATGVWIDSNLIYQNLSLEIQPLGINFVSPAQIPVFFIQQDNRLVLVAENTPFWDGEVTYIPEAPVSSVVVNNAELIWQEQTVASAVGQSYTTHPGLIAVDADGYVYSPSFPVSNVSVMPPNSAGVMDNKTWGGFWDHFRHPRGIAVDNTRSKVYITNDLLTGGSAGVQTNGQVLIWDLAKRTQHVGYIRFRAPIPADWDHEYRPRVLTHSFVWPSDVAVDEVRGLLYVSNSANSKIDVFDVKNSPVYLYSFGSEGKAVGQFQFPQGLDLDKNGNLYVVDSENHRIQKFVYDQIIARQVFSATWGQLGSKLSVSGDIRFRYPVDIAVDDTHNRIYVADPTNKRVTVLDLNGNFVHQWTERANGITVDDKGLVYVAIDLNIVKFKVPDTPLEPPPPPDSTSGSGGGSGRRITPPTGIVPLSASSTTLQPTDTARLESLLRQLLALLQQLLALLLQARQR